MLHEEKAFLDSCLATDVKPRLYTVSFMTIIGERSFENDATSENRLRCCCFESVLMTVCEMRISFFSTVLTSSLMKPHQIERGKRA